MAHAVAPKFDIVMVCKTSLIIRRGDDDPTHDKYVPVVHMLLTNATHGSPMWRELRKRITASVWATCLGLSPFGTPRDKWRQMLFDPTYAPQANAAMKDGVQGEWFAIHRWTMVTGMPAIESPVGILLSDPNMAATPDLLSFEVDQKGRVWMVLGECKLPEYGMYDYPPIYYVVQMFLQMKTYEIWTNYLICVSKVSGHVRIWRVRWTQSFWNYLEERTDYFCQCMQNRVEPLPERLRTVYHCVEKIYKKDLKMLKEIARERKQELWQLPEYLVCNDQRYEQLKYKYAKLYKLDPREIPPRYNFSIVAYDRELRTFEGRRVQRKTDLDVRRGMCYTNLALRQYPEASRSSRWAVCIIMMMTMYDGEREPLCRLGKEPTALPLEAAANIALTYLAIADSMDV